ncbi:hypothetical protein BKI52_13545 [marine bacterium AO1-C]|nr:hypothetical protein BKI52_13545 [marine bacterium AO1-C]
MNVHQFKIFTLVFMLCFLGIITKSSAQLFFSKKASLKYKSINLDTAQNTITLHYDLKGPSNRLYITRLYYSSNNGNGFKGPLRSVSGDAGDSIAVGDNKKIVWTFVKDNPYFTGKNIIFKIEATEKPKIAKGGPKNALKSLMFPGLGDYKVRNGYHYEWIPTATFVMLGAGIFFRFNADKLYQDYEDRLPNSENDYNALFNRAQTRNILSQGLLMAGAALWIGDIVGVYLRGKKNQKKFAPKKDKKKEDETANLELKRGMRLLPTKVVPSINTQIGYSQLSFIWKF